jgi:2-amino-4-hydroxy-6-hydroxymethyldihydropteridine diphosphokinase
MIIKLLFAPTTCSRGCGGGGGGMMITIAWSSATSSRSINCFTIRSSWMSSSRSNSAAVAKQLQWRYHHRRWLSSYSDSSATTSTATGPSGNKSSSPLLQNMAYIAVGSNMGDRFRNIHQALELLSSPSSDIHQVLDLLPYKPSSEEELEDNDDQIELQVTRTSFLYETQPMYFVDQPPFLNGAIQVYTNLSPLQLLNKCKLVEQILGREDSAVPMKGPRPIDLDLLLYYDNYKNNNITSPASIQHEDHELKIPHPGMAEREFVLQPMVELDPYAIIPDDSNNNTTILEALQELKKEEQQLNNEENACVRVLPLPRNRVLTFGRHQTIIMGILNVTPDSFSDGGKVCVAITICILYFKLFIKRACVTEN